MGAVANLIEAEICERNYSDEIYPLSDDILKTGWIPPSLQVFLKLIIRSQVLYEIISQRRVKAVKPRIAWVQILSE